MKKGFTIIEIIISIGLILLVGTTSIVSFNFIKKNNKLKTLENMSDKILTAVNLYIETNSEVKSELYNNKNGLKIPLTTLENSGLVDFSNIDVSNEYVVTMLGSTDPEDDVCASTYTAKSWNFKSGETIYICEKSDGTSNLAIIDPTKYGNKTYVSNEPYYYRGYANNNYISNISNFSCDGSKFYDARIYAIDIDDRIIIATNIKCQTGHFIRDDKTYYSDAISTDLSNNDVQATGECISTSLSGSGYYSNGQWNYNYTENNSCNTYGSWLGTTEKLSYNYIVRLPNTCKITSGTGMSFNRFKITC